MTPNQPRRATTQAQPFPLTQVRLNEGIFKERQDIHAHYLMMIEPDRLVAPFRLQAGLRPKAERYGGWESRDISGHTFGHYLSALCFLDASTGDKSARERVDYVVDELAACQEANADGYVLPVAKQAFEALREGKIDASSFALNGVWVPFYTLHKMAVDPHQPVALVVTYWGGVWHLRVFDVLIDGEKLATQRLLNDKPGDFFDQAYSIPTELTADKTKVSIRFQSRPGDIAGGIFGLRLMRGSAVQAGRFVQDSALWSQKIS
jgi:hypothetical protein